MEDFEKNKKEGRSPQRVSLSSPAFIIINQRFDGNTYPMGQYSNAKTERTTHEHQCHDLQFPLLREHYRQARQA